MPSSTRTRRPRPGAYVLLERKTLRPLTGEKVAVVLASAGRVAEETKLAIQVARMRGGGEPLGEGHDRARDAGRRLASRTKGDDLHFTIPQVRSRSKVVRLIGPDD